MKSFLFATVLLSAALFVSSCKKDVHRSLPATGLWIGTYDVLAGETEADSLYYSFHLREDSVIQVQGLGADGNTYYGTGKWTRSNNDFSATIITTNLSQQGAVQHATGVFNLADGELFGIVESVGGPFRAGFSLKRIN